ncbi:hypothetical protein ACVJH7_002780 [Bradyrhizobium elkanii]
MTTVQGTMAPGTKADHTPTTTHTMLRNHVPRSLVSAMTHTPPSGPFALLTIRPIQWGSLTSRSMGGSMIPQRAGKAVRVTSGNRTPFRIEAIDAPHPGATDATLSGPLVVQFQLRRTRWPPNPLVTHTPEFAYCLLFKVPKEGTRRIIFPRCSLLIRDLIPEAQGCDSLPRLEPVQGDLVATQLAFRRWHGSTVRAPGQMLPALLRRWRHHRNFRAFPR